nr:hypothetical protein [Micromonospora craterilacus]
MLGGLLPGLLRDVQRAALTYDGDERRQAQALLAETLGLAQMFLAYQPAAGLLWRVADRGDGGGAGVRRSGDGGLRGVVPVPGAPGRRMCVGCRAWWSRLTPYPCWQVEWATSRQARTITDRFLSGVR